MPIARGRKKPSRGFSLIELLVSIAIIAIITATILARYSAFNSTVLLKDLAYEVALSIREAQSFGVSVRGVESNFEQVYGVHFVPGTTTYTLFVDTNENNIYNTGEAITTYNIGNNNKIGAVYTNSTSRDSLDVVFRRPEPDAEYYVNGSSTRVDANHASIEVTAPNGNKHTVLIYPTGQISIE